MTSVSCHSSTEREAEAHSRGKQKKEGRMGEKRRGEEGTGEERRGEDVHAEHHLNGGLTNSYLLYYDDIKLYM